MKTMLSLIAVASFALGGQAFAASKLATACKDDIKAFKCKGKSDHAIHECLEKHEQEGKENEGFTAACYQAHEAYEGAHKGGEHHDEKSEHHEEQKKTE